MKKRLTAILSVAVVTTLLGPGCGRQEAEEKASKPMPEMKPTVEITEIDEHIKAKAKEKLDEAKENVGEWVDEKTEQTQQAIDELKAKAGEAADDAGEWMDEQSEQTKQAVAEMHEELKVKAEEAVVAVGEMAKDVKVQANETAEKISDSAPVVGKVIADGIDKVNADIHRSADTTKAVAEAIDEVTAKLRGEVEKMEERQEKKVDEGTAAESVVPEESTKMTND